MGQISNFGLFSRKYLTDEQLEGLVCYNYSSISTGPISTYINRLFWKWLVQYHPKWLAPNLLTMLSFFLILAPFLIILYYDYDPASGFLSGSGVIPSWVWMICAIFSFWSHTYDAIDGLQARRTATTSPVGELFDHSLDSCKVLPFVLTLFAPFDSSESRVTPVRLLIMVFEILLSYSLAFWGQYFTKILYITWSFEMFYISFILHIVAYFDEANLATAYVFGQWKVCNLIQLTFHVCCIFSVLCSLYHIYQFYISRPAPERQNMIYSVKSLIPFAELYITAILWAIFSPGKVLQRDLLVFLFIISTANANLICRLIISHMSGTRADICNMLTLLYSAVALLSISNVLLPNEELLLMRFLAILLFVAHIHYFYCVVQQMCSKLKIEVFSLSYKSDRRKQG